MALSEDEFEALPIDVKERVEQTRHQLKKERLKKCVRLKVDWEGEGGSWEGGSWEGGSWEGAGVSHQLCAVTSDPTVNWVLCTCGCLQEAARERGEGETGTGEAGLRRSQTVGR